MIRRENTFRIHYASIPKKPTFDSVLSFCGDELGLGESEVLTVQLSRNLGCAFVKTIALEVAQRVCDMHDNKHVIAIDGKNYPLRITMEDGSVEVKITDLSESVSEEKISEFLRPFGDVISIREERYNHQKFSNIKTGVRLVRMVIHSNIESWVTIDGETTMLTYYGQRQTCRHCREYIHVGVTCVENRKMMVQKSYADATKQKQLPKAKSVATAAQRTKSKTSVAVSKKPEVRLTDDVNGKSLMPPPATVDIASETNFPSLPEVTPLHSTLASGSMTTFTGQKPCSSNRAARNILTVASTPVADGEETDESTESSSSTRLRPRNKKRREENENEQKEKELQ